MSYLNMVGGVDGGFKRAVISFWFRVPQESMDAARYAETGADGKMFDGIVPLVVMGKEGTGETPYDVVEDNHVLLATSSGTLCGGTHVTNITAECTGTEEILPGVLCCKKSLIKYDLECVCTSGTDEAYTTTYETTATGSGPETNPTFIGVDGNGYLYVNFESAQKPKVNNYWYQLTSVTPGSSSGSVIVIGGGDCRTGEAAFGCDVLCCVCLIIECSNSEEDNGEGYDHSTPGPEESPGTTVEPKYHYTEVSFAEDATGAIDSSSTIEVSADEWHHILVSVDLRPVVSHGYAANEDTTVAVGQKVDSAAKLWIALDDKNYTQYELSENWAEGRGDNDIITPGAYRIARSSADDSKDSPDGIPLYSLDSTSVPPGTIGIPATDKYADKIYRVEMAEFQMWVGEILDTGVESNRRAFIDYKRDAQGKFVSEKDGSVKLRPVNPDEAEVLIGKTPAILLHGSGRWKKGKNSGLGSDLEPTGAIERYKPDPAVSGGHK